MAVKAKTGDTLRKAPICKKTRQGQGRGSKPNHGRKKLKGQGR